MIEDIYLSGKQTLSEDFEALSGDLSDLGNPWNENLNGKRVRGSTRPLLSRKTETPTLLLYLHDGVNKCSRTVLLYLSNKY